MRRLSPFLALVAALILSCPSWSAPAPASQDRKAIQAEIWAKENAIYAGRGRGDLEPYLNSAADDFASWPPQAPAPVDLAALRASAPAMAKSKERLEMTFVDFRLHGDTAVIYYRTHITVRVDGTAADDRFEVTHTWVRDGGHWRVLGGMARTAPAGH